jgi:hypothetical protein
LIENSAVLVFSNFSLNDKNHNYVKKHNCEFYHSKIENITHFPQKIYKLSKTNIFFSHFEGTRGEKTQIFRTIEKAHFRTYIKLFCRAYYSSVGNQP